MVGLAEGQVAQPAVLQQVLKGVRVDELALDAPVSLGRGDEEVLVPDALSVGEDVAAAKAVVVGPQEGGEAPGDEDHEAAEVAKTFKKM